MKSRNKLINHLNPGGGEAFPPKFPFLINMGKTSVQNDSTWNFLWRDYSSFTSRIWKPFEEGSKIKVFKFSFFFTNSNINETDTVIMPQYKMILFKIAHWGDEVTEWCFNWRKELVEILNYEAPTSELMKSVDLTPNLEVSLNHHIAMT